MAEYIHLVGSLFSFFFFGVLFHTKYIALEFVLLGHCFLKSAICISEVSANLTYFF
jgi:hypothetical protein